MSTFSCETKMGTIYFISCPTNNVVKQLKQITVGNNLKLLYTFVKCSVCWEFESVMIPLI